MGSAFCFCRHGLVTCVGPWLTTILVAYLEHLVGRLLVFLGHGMRRGLGKGADGAEDDQAGGEAHGDGPGNAGIGAWGVDGAWAVRAEGDPVCWGDS